MNTRARLVKLLAAMGGGSERVLVGATNSRVPLVLISLAMFVTAGMGGLSMWVLLHTGLHLGPVAASVGAVSWFGAMLVIEVLLTQVLQGGGGVSTAVLTVLRLAMAVLIGLVVSTPLVLWVFRGEITFQMGQRALDTAEANERAVADSPQRARVDELDAQVAAQEAILAGTLAGPVEDSDAVTSAAARVDRLRAQLPELRHAADQASMLFNCEVYGGARSQLDNPDKCSPEPGWNGPNVPAYQHAVTQTAEHLDQVESQLAAAKVALATARDAQEVDRASDLVRQQAEAEQALPGLRDDLRDAEGALTALEDKLAGENAGNVGLLAQLKGLHEVTKEDTLLLWTHIVLISFLTLFEVLPVTAKVAFAHTRPGRNLEQSAQLVDRQDLQVQGMTMTQELQREQHRLDHKAGLDRQLDEDINNAVAAVERQRAMAKLKGWLRAAQQAPARLKVVGQQARKAKP